MHRDCELLVIGGGMAAGRLMQQLHEHAYSKKTIVISGEKHAGYNRVMLPGFLAGQYSVEQMCGQADWQSRSNFTVLPGLTVTQIEQSSRSVLTDSGMQIGFTELVIATGSTVVRPQTTGTELAGVVELRNLNDAEQLQSMAARGRHAVVVGGGLLGLEAADALLQLGMQVRVVHRGGQLMNRQLDQAAGEELGRILSHRGMHLSLGAQLGAIEGDRQVESVVLDDGAS
ncbi:MAG: FAD-dependent oxidoreductase, partial [Pseudomonadota bacterium]